MNINSNGITLNISDVCTESVSKTTPPIRNPNLESEYFGNTLKSLRTSNLHHIIIAQINVNSIRNKFEALANEVSDNVDILLTSENKNDDSFSLTQFLIEGFTTPYILDRNGSGGDFNAEESDATIKDFCDIYSFKNLIKNVTCFKNPDKPKSIDLMLTNRNRSFQNSCVIDTGLPHFHKITVTVLRSHLNKLGPKIIHYRDYKIFSNDAFRSEEPTKLQ